MKNSAFNNAIPFYINPPDNNTDFPVSKCHQKKTESSSSFKLSKLLKLGCQLLYFIHQNFLFCVQPG